MVDEPLLEKFLEKAAAGMGKRRDQLPEWYVEEIREKMEFYEQRGGTSFLMRLFQASRWNDIKRE